MRPRITKPLRWQSGSLCLCMLAISCQAAGTVRGQSAPPSTLLSSGGRQSASSPSQPAAFDNSAWTASPSATQPQPGDTPAGAYPVISASHAAPPANETPLAATNVTSNLRPRGDSAPQPAQKVTPLKPPSSEAQAGAAAPSSGSTGQMFLSVGSSLLIVLGLFFGVAWCYRKTLSSSIGGGLPKQVVSVLGRTSLSPRQQMVLVRFGSKLVLVSVIQGEARTLSEITDPLEVDQLAGLCESQSPGSISNSFKSVLLNEGGRR